MRAMPALTPSQKAGLVAWWLAHGDGLTEARIKSLGGTDEPWQLLACIKRIADVRCDETATWAWYGGALGPAENVARNRPHDRRKDRKARERAALVAFYLATQGEVRTPELVVQLGLTRQAVVFMMSRLSLCLPIYYDAGKWQVLSFKEELN